MKFVPLLRLALVQLCLVPNAFAQEEGHASHLSPDGRFVFEAFSSEEVDAEKRPDFGIIERATGKLVSDPREPLGNASRPEDGLAERWLEKSESRRGLVGDDFPWTTLTEASD